MQIAPLLIALTALGLACVLIALLSRRRSRSKQANAMNEVELARAAFLRAQDRGEPISLAILHNTYLADLDRTGRTEAPEAAQLWTTLIWQRLNKGDLKALAHKARHPEQFAAAVAPMLRWL